MNIGKLLASRNAKTVRFNAIRAGHIDMPTAQIVNGALAACPHTLGAKVLECIHSPECADPVSVGQEVMGLLLKEHARRAERLVEAESVVHLARAGLSQRYTEAQASARFEQIKAERWPRFFPEKYQRVIVGVFHELLRKQLCDDCGGRGTVTRQALIAPCVACNGTGRARLTNNARAVLCEMHHVSFQIGWEPVYTWLHAHLMGEIKRAEDFIYAYANGPS